MRYVRAFGAFWYDFLVGDRPELFAGPIAALALGWLMVRGHAGGGVDGVVLFLAVVAVAAFSLLLSTRPRR